MEVIEPRFVSGVAINATCGSKVVVLNVGEEQLTLYPEDVRPIIRGLLRGLLETDPCDWQARSASLLMIDLEYSLPEEAA